VVSAEGHKRISEGRSTAEIVEEVRLPTSAIAPFQARWTQGYLPEGLGDIQPSPEVEDGPGSDEVEDAVVTTFGLERDLQRTLRETIAQLEPDLKIIDEGREHRSAARQIDLLCDGGDGALMVVDLEAGVAKDAALGQDQARDDGGRSLRRSAGPRGHGRQGLQRADAPRLLRAPQPPARELRHPLHLRGPQLRLSWTAHRLYRPLAVIGQDDDHGGTPPPCTPRKFWPSLPFPSSFSGASPNLSPLCFVKERQVRSSAMPGTRSCLDAPAGHSCFLRAADGTPA
jgi:hypothetical protein